MWILIKYTGSFIIHQLNGERSRLVMISPRLLSITSIVASSMALFLSSVAFSLDSKKTDSKSAECKTQAKKTGTIEKEKGWQQERHNGLGREILYANEQGVKIYYPEVGLNVVSRAPSWDVVWFSNKTRQQYKETLEHYRERKNMVPASVPPPTLQETKSTFAGLNSRKLAVPSGPRITYYYVTEPVKLPTGALTFLGTFFGMPNFGGIPLACTELNKYNPKREQNTWYTVSSERKLLPDSTFSGPPGSYVHVANASDITLNNATDAQRKEDRVKQNAAAEDVAKQMGVGVPFKK